MTFMSGTKKKPDAAASLSAMLRGGEPVPAGAKLALVVRMSVPAMMAEFAHMAMSCIDAAMIGRLGTEGAAAVGLAASSTWFFGGVCWAGVVGFSVQIAQAVGAGRQAEARSVLRQGLAVLGCLSLALAAAGAAVSPWLPGWLGGKGDTALLAARYFAICMAGVPFLLLDALFSAALQARGDMRTPGSLNVQMCLLDVLFNLLLIFPSREWTLPFGVALRLPGAGLGVAGAALGTALAEAVTAWRLGRALLARDPVLALRADERLRLSRRVVLKAAKLSAPVALENAAMNAAVVATTAVVAPLGDVAIAANSFAATAEGMCYLPCIGIRAAAQTIAGQAIGAARGAAARSFAFLATACGMVAMACGGVLLWFAAPFLIGLFTREPDVLAEGAAALRAVAFAEPFFAAAIVGGGALRGAGDTLVPGAFNSLSMWCVRLPLAAFLADLHGLRGVWEAIAVELVVRGCFALARLRSSGWSGGGKRESSGARGGSRG